MNYLTNFKTFGENKALYDGIVVIYRLLCKQIFMIKKTFYCIRVYWYLVTIHIDSIQSTSLRVQPNKYCTYLGAAAPKKLLTSEGKGP